MFNSDRQLQKDFKEHFRNISRIMDCVGCEKCRLWGKIQVSGVGTALKILFSFDDESIRSKKDFALTKSELVTLFNAFGRITESIDGLAVFRQLKLQHRHEQQQQSQPDPPPSSLILDTISMVIRKALSPIMYQLWTETFIPAVGNLHPLLHRNQALADLLILSIVLLVLTIGFRKLLSLLAIPPPSLSIKQQRSTRK
jgi:hypothetical protein